MYSLYIVGPFGWPWEDLHQIQWNSSPQRRYMYSNEQNDHQVFTYCYYMKTMLNMYILGYILDLSHAFEVINHNMLR